ncbi:Uncharacterized protein CK203_080411 [Vitis vinifera]|uniref:DNA/RNA-binding protein Alba-like domain-containing protein n=1 Tax=Vitis vinifera TaxID=29760 RepID=A0A438F291_VITVI|nr:Uncharacterized protein CK203_080411 [Vitis vinifera]
MVSEYFLSLQRFMQQYNDVELSALGMAIATVVTIAEILKNNGLAVEKRITTSTVDIRDEFGGRPLQKQRSFTNTCALIYYFYLSQKQGKKK